MSSNIDKSKINKKKVKTSMIPISSLNPKILRKIAKTPEIMYIKGSSLNSQRLNISNSKLEPINQYKSLTLTKDGNPKNIDNLLYQEYLITNSKYHQIISEIENLNKKIVDGNKKIVKLTENLKKLKEDKKQKQSDIVNLLSNKESLEEIYKNKVSYLIYSKELKSKKGKDNNNNNNNKVNDDDKNKDNNCDELKSHLLSDSEAFKIDQEKELEIKVEEIQRSEKKKFIEQVISFIEEIFQSNEEEFCKQIREKIILAYKIFFTEISSTNINEDFIISNFFLRISLFISNHSLGNYSEKNINKFLRYLLKINSIGVVILQVIKFLNKKYKEVKREIKEQINNLKKRDENYKDKIIMLEKNKEEMKQFIDKNSELFKDIKYSANNTIDDIYWPININDLNISNERSIIKKKLSQTSRENKEDFYDDKNYIIINEKNDNSTGRKSHELNTKLLSSHGVIRKFIRNRPKNLIKEYKSNKVMNDENKDILANSAILNNVLDKNHFSSKNLKNNSNKAELPKILNNSNNDNNHNNNNSDMISNYNSNDSKHEIVNNINSNNNTYTEINDDIADTSKNINKGSKISNLIINDINIKKYIKANKEKNHKDDGKIYIVNSHRIKDLIKLKPVNTKKYYHRKEVNELAMKKNNTSELDNNIFIKKSINKNLNHKNDVNKSLNRENDIINDNNLLSESNMNRTSINDQNLLLNKNKYNIPKKRYNKNIYIINNINNSEQINNNNNIYNRTIDKDQINHIITNTEYINENERFFKDGIKPYNEIEKDKGKFVNKNLNRELSHKETNEKVKKNIVINKLNIENLYQKIPHLKQTSNTPRTFIKINNNRKHEENLIGRNIINRNETNKVNNIPRAKKKLTDGNLLNKYSKTNSFYGIKSKKYVIPSNKIKINNKDYRLIKNKAKDTIIPISTFIKGHNSNNNERNSYNIVMDEKLNKTELSYANNNNNSMNMLSP